MKNKHQRAFALLFALLLAIGLTTTTLAFTSAIQPVSENVSIQPAVPEYVDFTPQITYTDNVDVGFAPACSPPSGAGMVGWDMDETAFRYDRENDQLLIGVSMWNNVIAGDPENNGNPSTSHTCLTNAGGSDLPNMDGSEGIDIILDTDNDGTYDYIAGIPNGSNLTGLTVASYNGEATPTDDNVTQGYGTTALSTTATLLNNPSTTAPDFEFSIDGFSDLFTNSDSGDSLTFCLIARAGSGADAGFGEDIFPNTGCQSISFSADYDYGDLPTTYTETRHILDGETYLGTLIDAEDSNQPDGNALGDDDNDNDDEDGVTFLSALIPGESADVQVVASADGYLNAWIDFEGDNSFEGDKIVTDTALFGGVNIVTFDVPLTLTTTSTLYARFRFTKNEGEATSPGDTALNGEVEDYALMTLGDRVWDDGSGAAANKNNRLFDTDEVGIGGVRVDLYRGTDFLGRTTTTDTAGIEGQYFFRGLQPGNYTVRVIASNFVGNQPLQDYISSSGNGSANADTDNDDNGIDNASPTTNNISSGSITLALGDEPQPLTNTNTTLDFGFVVFTPTIAITKTVYLGDDSGAVCTGGTSTNTLAIGTNGTTVTYCFEVSNTSNDVWLNNIKIDDDALGIDQNDMTVTDTNSSLLAPNGTNYYYYTTTIDGDLVNTATAEGQPATEGGQPLIGLAKVTDTDSAEVDEVTPSVALQKTVYYGDNNGASCPGAELVTNINGASVTYCFEITNTGDTYLDSLIFSDSLGITLTDLVALPSTGVLPLEPNQSLRYYYEGEIDGNFTNSATITATATDDSGTALAQIDVVTDTDTAQVREITPSVQIRKTVYQGHDNGASCNADTNLDLVTDVNGANVTYCFEVMNSSAGNYLAISISDPALGITEANMELLSGNLPLVPGTGVAIYYYETTINGDLLNTATVTGNPVNSSNNDYPNVNNVTDSDTAEVDEVAPAIEIQKTVYVGSNNGASCPGSDLITDEQGEDITYCFEVTNTGDTYLNNITIDDDGLGINETNMTLISGGTPLTPGMSLSYYYTTEIDGDLLNTATVTGNPSDANGNDLTGIDSVTDSDTAEVNQIAPSVEITKTVYLNIDNGVSCPTSGELVTGLNGNAVTYCFVVTNTGDTYLDNIDLDDNNLGIDDADMTLLSGDDTQPLAPDASLAYYYETTITDDITNTVSIEANPTLANGTDFTGVSAITDTDTAQVEQIAPDITLEKTVALGTYSGAGSSCEGDESVAALNGDDVTYCFKIINTGDTYLNLSLTDNPLGISLVDMSLVSGTLPLAPGASIEYYYETEVDGDLVNIAEVIGNPVDANFIDIANIPNVSDQDDAEVNEVSPGIALEKSVYLGVNGGASCPGDEVVTGRQGANITYCFEVRNTSDTYLDVALDDPALAITDSAGLLPALTTPLAPGASHTFFYQTTIMTDVINLATATGTPVDANGVPLGLENVDDANSAKVAVAQADVQLEKKVYAGANGGASCPGFNIIAAKQHDAITYCFQVTNMGNTYLNNITIDDDDLGINQDDMQLLARSDALPLAPGDNLYYYYQTFVSGPLTNTAEVVANPSDEDGNDLAGVPNVSDDDTAIVIDADPDIEIEKTVHSGIGDDSSCPGEEIVTGQNGDPVTYCFVITNTGDTNLTDILVSDVQLDVTIDLTDTHLLPGQSLTRTITSTIDGPLVNTVTVEANPVDSNWNDLDGLTNVTDQDSATVGQAGLTLEKSVGTGHINTNSLHCEDTGDLATGTAGTAIYYCFEVTNTGSTYLTDLMITDTILGININDLQIWNNSGSLPLASGESIVYYYKSLINDDVVNTADASATPSDANGTPLANVQPITDTDTATVELVSSPNIALHKTVYAGTDNGSTCPGVEFVNGLPGSDIIYCFEVENTGDTYLDSITISDTLLGIDDSDMTVLTGTTRLAPGASIIYYYETSLDNDLVNTANVTGTPTDQNGVAIDGLDEVTDSDSATVEEASSPDVTIAKTVYRGHNTGAGCSSSGELVEDVLNTAITYCFEVENTGDTYLDDIMITDTLLSITVTDMSLFTGTQPLAPGASIIYYYQDTITGDLVNTAEVEATPSDQNGGMRGGFAVDNVTDSDTAQVHEVGSPGVQIHKTVYLGQDAGESCPGDEFIEADQDSLMTYCFEIENTGDTYLDDIIITDVPLSITQENMTLVITGSVPIAPGESAVYYYETTVEQDLINTAEVNANPTDAEGNDIAELDNVTDSDTAQISANIATALAMTDLTANQEHGYSLAALLMLLAGGVVLAYKTIFSKQKE